MDVFVSFTSPHYQPAAALAPVTPDVPPVSVNTGDSSLQGLVSPVPCFPPVTSRCDFTPELAPSLGDWGESTHWSNTPGSYRESLLPTTFPRIL